MAPLVSIVIPTRNRPHLVARAVQSALAQTWQDTHIIVVIDGQDDATAQRLREILDPRLGVVALGHTVGHAQARNVGVRHARGEWIAFLDDDDEWLPEKLETQVSVARHSRYAHPIVYCQAIARTKNGSHIVPRRLPQPDEAVSDYLFCQHGLRGSEGLLMPIALFAPRDLLQRIPFRTEAGMFDGSDWALRAARVEGVGVEFARATVPLAIWHAAENRAHVSKGIPWRVSLYWAQTNKHLLTPQAYAGFLMTWLSVIAERQGDWSAFFVLPREALGQGRVRMIDIIAHLLIWLVPSRLRRRIVRVLESLNMMTPSTVEHPGLKRAG